MADERPPDPIGDAVAAAMSDMVRVATVELRYAPEGADPPVPPVDPSMAAATCDGPPGWRTTVVVRLTERVARLVPSDRDTSHLTALLEVLPAAAVATIAPLRRSGAARGSDSLDPAFRRALRDAFAIELLAAYAAPRTGTAVPTGLIADTLEFLIELTGTRIESHEVSHGVVITDVLDDTPALELAYPADVRRAKRGPLLFDGHRSVLLVDPAGRARIELQRHRLQSLLPDDAPRIRLDDTDSAGWLVAEATRHVGGLGLLARGDRSIWTFADGRPLLVRRAEHWSAFPLDLTAPIEDMIGGGPVAGLVTRAAFMISGRPGGAILAIVDRPDRLDGIVSPKDRYDLRHELDPTAMAPEARLHHLIDADHLDEHTLVRLATLDGATILDGEGRLLAYGAVVTSLHSQHEGARTAAARTLSKSAEVVLKISTDGDITVFREGAVVTTLLPPVLG